MKAYRGTKPVKNNFFLILCLKIFGIAFTLYIQKFEKNEVVNIFTYGPEWVKETVVVLGTLCMVCTVCSKQNLRYSIQFVCVLHGVYCMQ